MKTIITFLALMTALFGQVSVTKTELYMSGGPATIDLAMAKVTTALTFQMTAPGGPILTISPLPSEERKLPNDYTELWPRYHRPEKPEEITVTLWTKDGKKWVAKWEEVKP